MSIILFNPTDEEFTGTYEGIDTKLPPDCKLKVADKKGKHLLTHLGPRGLTQLDYGDERTREDGTTIEDDKRKAGRKRWHQFRRRQVERWNQDQIARRNSGRDGIEPTEIILEYAKAEGIGLEELYSLPDAKNEEISELRATNSNLERQLGNLTNQVAELMAALREGKTPQTIEEQKEASVEAEVLACREKYERLKNPQFITWAGGKNGRETYHTAPPVCQDEIRRRWETICDKDKPFPY